MLFIVTDFAAPSGEINLTSKRLVGGQSKTRRFAIWGSSNVLAGSSFALRPKLMESNVLWSVSLMASSFTNVCIPQGRYLCSVTRLYVTTKVLATSPVWKVKVVSFLVVSTGRFIVVPRPVKAIPEKSVV